MTSEPKPIFLRVEADLLAALDAELERRRAAAKGVRCTLSDVVRALLWSAIEATPKVAPKPKSKPPKSAPRKSRCPSSEAPEAGAWCSTNGVPLPTLEPDVARFLDHHAAKGSLFLDWAAAWRNWASGRFVGGRPPKQPGNGKNYRHEEF